MSRSPRRLLRRAADALGALDEVSARHPEVRAELERALTPSGAAELARAVQVITRAADVVDGLAPDAPDVAGEPLASS